MNGRPLVYEFGPFRLDPKERRLLRNGRPVPLRSKVFDTLCMLVENHGRLVGKDVLMKAVWPDAIVEEGNLAHNVAALRRALGGKGVGRAHVETVPGRGYRFIAPVVSVASGPADAGPPAGLADPPLAAWRSRVETTRASVAGLPASSAGKALPDPLVGRATELAALRAGVDAARDGRGVLLCLAGEPGIGKSAVIAQFLAAQPEWGPDCIVAVGRCSELLAGSEAYLPVLEALDALVQGPGGRELGELMKLVAPTWYVQVQPLWATLDASFAPVAAEARAASRERMKRELLAFLQQVADARPLILVFDDLHWADASTIELLAYVGRKLDSLRAVIVAAYRSAELLLTRHAFIAVRQELQRQRLCQEMALELLTRDDIERYVALELPGADLPSSFADFLHRRTEGNPLFMVDLVRHLRRQGVLAESGGRWQIAGTLEVVARSLPESVRNLIQRRVDLLADDDLTVLAVASVQGHQFESRVIADVTGLEPAAIEDRLRALEEVHGFVRFQQESLFPDGSVSLGYAFAHVLYQHAILDSLSRSRRADLSRSAAESLLRRHERAPTVAASQVAILFEAARDYERAADFFLVAAGKAARLFANDEAVALSRRAIACAEQLEGAARHGRVLAATFEIAQLHMVLSRFEEAAAGLQAAERIAIEAGDVEGQIRAVCGYAMALFSMQRFEEMSREGDRAVALAQGPVSPEARAAADTIQAMVRMNVGDLTAAEERFSRAIPVLRQEGLWVQSLDAIFFRGLLHHLRLEFAQVEQTSAWAIPQARRLGATFNLVENLFCWGMAQANRGRLSDAMATLREGIRVGELNGERFFVARLANTLAWLHGEMLDVESAVRLGRDAVLQAREMHVHDAVVHARLNLAGAYLDLGDPGAAEIELRAARDVLAAEHLFVWRQQIRFEEMTAALWLARGDFEKATAHAVAALEQSKQTLSRKHIAWSRKLLADVAARRGRHAAAAQAYGAALRILEQHPCPLLEWRILSSWAAVEEASRSARAGELRARARSVQESLAVSIDDERGRARFLAGAAPSLA